MSATDIKKPRGRPRQTAIESAPAKALDKGLSALRRIAESDGISLNDLSLDLEMPLATLHRLLLTLESHGFVRQSKSDATWSIGIEAFRVGSAFPRAAKLLSIARPVLKDLALKTGETANLGVIDQSEVIFIAQHETHHAIRAFFRPGSRSSWHSSGIGKVIVAFSDPLDRRSQLEKAPFEQFTQHTLVQVDELIQELKRIRNVGYAFDQEERFIGMRCIGAPVFNSNNQVVAGISISGPVARMSDDLIVQLAQETARHGEEISKQLGARAEG
ncbi:MAG: IclR family transcriptional regulator [Litoricolaceae bacterium]|nr:IclR family transcriptional regulator [Litorivicinaceae bacterium]